METTQHTPHGDSAELREFTTLGAIYQQAGLSHQQRASSARAKLRMLCAEEDSERERYRQETIERAREEAIAWFERETARLKEEIRQIEAQIARVKGKGEARETDEETESEAGE